MNQIYKIFVALKKYLLIQKNLYSINCLIRYTRINDNYYFFYQNLFPFLLIRQAYYDLRKYKEDERDYLFISNLER
jgi:hypothetical protein